ncbi:MAG TPA: TetR/AcrR family transcriptional regulator [Trueperaceae bacterium]|nr:TetR/AcrR family transcriptional regulator [Trueperaceae bacterium]
MPLFAARGYQGVSMREVAAAVGVSKAAIYHHYADKEELFLALLLAAVARAGGLVERALATNGDTEAKLRALLKGIASHRSDQRVAMRLAEQEAVHLSEAGRTKLFGEYRARFTGPIEALMAEGQAAGELRRADPRWQATALLTLAQSLLDPRERGVTGAAVLELFLHGAAVS